MFGVQCLGLKTSSFNITRRECIYETWVILNVGHYTLNISAKHLLSWYNGICRWLFNLFLRFPSGETLFLSNKRLFDPDVEQAAGILHCFLTWKILQKLTWPFGWLIHLWVRVKPVRVTPTSDNHTCEWQKQSDPTSWDILLHCIVQI